MWSYWCYYDVAACREEILWSRLRTRGARVVQSARTLNKNKTTFAKYVVTFQVSGNYLLWRTAFGNYSCGRRWKQSSESMALILQVEGSNFLRMFLPPPVKRLNFLVFQQFFFELNAKLPPKKEWHQQKTWNFIKSGIIKIFGLSCCAIAIRTHTERSYSKPLLPGRLKKVDAPPSFDYRPLIRWQWFLSSKLSLGKMLHSVFFAPLSHHKSQTKVKTKFLPQFLHYK